jgi:hypothetical protein
LIAHVRTSIIPLDQGQVFHRRVRYGS